MKRLKRLGRLLLASFLGLCLAACSLPGLAQTSKQTVKIACISTTESQIMAEMLKQLIEEETDLEAEIVNNLGSSSVVHAAMLRDDAQISACRYTGTDLAVALERDPITDPEEAMETIQTEFASRFDQKFYDSYGFENTYTVLVRPDYAEEHGLEKVSDLEALKDEIRFGVDSSWLDRAGDGYEGFSEHYGFSFDQITPMQIGLVYDALESKAMDAVLGYSTDGRISSYNLVALEDDLRFFPPYDAAPAARGDFLRQHPEVDELLERMKGQIDTSTMQSLNYEVDHKLQEPQLVAKNFLLENNFFRGEG